MAPEAPAADLLRRAERADLAARSDEALELLAGCEEWPQPYNEHAVLLRSSVLRLRDPIAALDTLPDAASAFTTHEGRVRYFIASARAYTSARNLVAASEMLEAAEREIRAGDDVQRAWLAFTRARLQWQRRQYDPKSADLQTALRAADPGLRFAALNVKAWMHLGLDDSQSFVESLIECISVYRQFPADCHLVTVADTLQTAADAAWETHDNRLAEIVRSALDGFPWTPDLRVQHLLCRRALAWNRWLNGDVAGAAERFDDLISLAPSLAWKTLLYADRAQEAALSSDAPAAAAALRTARSLEQCVDWPQTRNEERMALITLAVLVAPEDALAAQRYIAAYHHLRPHSLEYRVEASHEPRRIRAFQEYADGRIAGLLGRTEAAVRLLRSAYDAFTEFGLVFRAALTAEALFELTGEQHWLAAARSHASVFSQSPISKRLGC